VGEALVIPVTVVLKLEWVLRSRFKFSKSDVMDTLSAMLATIELVFESEGALKQALANYEEGSADFGEYLDLALAHYGQALSFWALDVKASKAVGARLLNA
jgi:predicted nucleic-acid-binding protein